MCSGGVSLIKGSIGSKVGRVSVCTGSISLFICRVGMCSCCVGLSKTSVGSQMSGIMNFALGVRVSPKTIANVNVGFGVTELSPDIILGLSLPIDIEGVKPAEGN